MFTGYLIGFFLSRNFYTRYLRVMYVVVAKTWRRKAGRSATFCFLARAYYSNLFMRIIGAFVFYYARAMLRSVRAFRIKAYFYANSGVVDQGRMFRNFSERRFCFYSRFFRHVGGARGEYFCFQVGSLYRVFFEGSRFRPLSVFYRFFKRLGVFSFRKYTIFYVVSYSSLRGDYAIECIFSCESSLVRKEHVDCGAMAKCYSVN